MTIFLKFHPVFSTLLKQWFWYGNDEITKLNHAVYKYQTTRKPKQNQKSPNNF